MAKMQDQGGSPLACPDFTQGFMARMQDHDRPLTKSSDVAEGARRAATDPSCPMRLPVGAVAVALAG
jgi:hypothetical protein